PEAFGLADLFSAIRRDGPWAHLTKLPTGDRAYFEGIVETRDSVPAPQVVLTTMHGAKGREADLVIAIPDMTRETYRAYTQGRRSEYESENRVFYVAVTRAKQELVLVNPVERRHFTWPAIKWE